MRVRYLVSANGEHVAKRMSWSTQRKVFISHSAQDRAFVVRLTRALQRHGVRYWYSAQHIKAAQEWHDAIGRALEECNWFVVVLTPAAVRSIWVKRELAFVLRQRRYNERIIPVLLKSCEFQNLSWTLEEFEFIDFTNDFGKACRQLLRIWGIKYQPDRVSGKSAPKKKPK